MNTYLSKASWLLMASVTSGMVALSATPSQAASNAFSESLLEFKFSQDFFASDTDTDTDVVIITEDDKVFADTFADADILNSNGPDISECLFDLGLPGACNVALSVAAGDDGNNYFGRAESYSTVLGDFFVTAGNIFSFDFVASLLLETKIERPNVESAHAAGEASFAVYGGTKSHSLSLLDTFTLTGALSTLGEDDSLTQSQPSSALKFKSVFNQAFGGQNEFVDVFTEGSYDRTFDADTYLQLVEVKTSEACVATADSGRGCKQSVPEPTSVLALIAPLLGLTGLSLKKKPLD